MALVHVTTINRLVLKGVLRPHKTKYQYLFEEGYARRLAPIISARNELAFRLKKVRQG